MHDQTLTHPIDKKTDSRPVPASSPSDMDPEVPGESSLDAFVELNEADVRHSLGAVGLVCRSVLACLLAVGLALGLAVALAVMLLP